VRLQWNGDGMTSFACCGSRRSAYRTTSFWPRWADGTGLLLRLRPELDDVSGATGCSRQGVHDAPGAYGFCNAASTTQSAQEITDVLKVIAVARAPSTTSCKTGQYGWANQWLNASRCIHRYPDPAGMINTIHTTYNAHFMISVWPKFYPPPRLHRAERKGYVYTPNITEGKKDFLAIFTFYDAFQCRRADHVLVANEHGAVRYRRRRLVDDATEPEIVEGPSPVSTRK